MGRGDRGRAAAAPVPEVRPGHRAEEALVTEARWGPEIQEMAPGRWAGVHSWLFPLISGVCSWVHAVGVFVAPVVRSPERFPCYSGLPHESMAAPWFIEKVTVVRVLSTGFLRQFLGLRRPESRAQEQNLAVRRRECHGYFWPPSLESG